MTPFLSQFRPPALINSAKRLANHWSFRGNSLQIGLLSSSLWLATQASCSAFFPKISLEPQFAGDSYLAGDQNIGEEWSRNLKKMAKPGDKRWLPTSPLNVRSESFLLGQSSSVLEASAALGTEIDSSTVRQRPLAPSLEVSEASSLRASDLEESEIDFSGANPSAEPVQSLDLSPELLENSPVLQRWLEEVPDLLSDINQDPSFRTRLRIGYSEFPSTDQRRGFNLGVEDIFVGRTGLTVSGDYHRNGEGDRQSYGVDLRYYLFSLGSRLNVAPVVGYRYLQTGAFNTDGINLGIRLLVTPSRTGAADISLTQSWVSPTSSEEVGITLLSLGYAVTRDLRISTDIQAQNSPFKQDSRVGISLEWML